MQTLKSKLTDKWKQIPLRIHWLVFAGLCIVAYALFAHPDVVETSNHSYLLLDSIFKGKFFHFYEYVAAHPFGKELYYINDANYNIVIYLIFGIAELPVYLFNAIFGTYNEPTFYFVGKLVSAGFFFGCIPLVQKIARELKLDDTTANRCALFFALSAPAFFSAMVMAQYDSISLFFMLLGVLYWMRNDNKRFLFWFGIAAASKFFALFLLVPLIVLREKRLLHILKNGLLSLWLLVPTTLLFWGRTGNMEIFTGAMFARLFNATIPATRDIPMFLLLYAVLCVVALLWKPGDARIGKAGIWFGLAVFSALFLFIEWHPQWLILLAPFITLTTFCEKNRVVWWWLDIASALGLFLISLAQFPLEGNLLDYGIMSLWFGLHTDMSAYVMSIRYLSNIPFLIPIATVLFTAPLLCGVVLKFPAKSGTLAARLSDDSKQPPANHIVRYAWFVFGAGIACWLIPTLFTWVTHFVGRA